MDQMARINSQRTQRDKSTMKIQFGIRDSPNPLLQLPLDLRDSASVEST